METESHYKYFGFCDKHKNCYGIDRTIRDGRVILSCSDCGDTCDVGSATTVRDAWHIMVPDHGRTHVRHPSKDQTFTLRGFSVTEIVFEGCDKYRVKCIIDTAFACRGDESMENLGT